MPKLQNFIFETCILQFNLNIAQKWLKIGFLNKFEGNDFGFIYNNCDKIEKLWINRGSIETISKFLSGNPFPSLNEMDISFNIQVY